MILAQHAAPPSRQTYSTDSAADRVAAIIDDAGFSDDDRDIATSGLCATFALALHDRLRRLGLQATLGIASVGKIPDDRAKASWRHALVEIEGELFDIDGAVEAEHVIANYCWGTISPICAITTLSRTDFIRLLRNLDVAYDKSRHWQWARQLKSAS